MAILGERVLHHRREGLLLPAQRDDLAPDGVVRVVGVDEADEVRRHIHPELVRCGQTVTLLVGEVEDLLDLGEIVHAVRELPAPVVPLLVGHVHPECRAAAAGRLAIRAQDARGIAWVHPGLVGRDGSDGRVHGRLLAHAGGRAARLL